MFVIEKLKRDLERKQEAWVDACNKWISEGGNDGYHNYRSISSYISSHGHSPKHRISSILKFTFYAILASIVVFCVLMWGIEIRNNPPEPVKAASEYTKGEQCKDFKVGDVTTIEYGDYMGAEVEIIGGCEDHAEYETRVTKDQRLNGDDSSSSDFTDKDIKKDLIIKVDNTNNLTKTGQ